MKKFSRILENINNQKYFEILATINLIVEASSEGEAGYLGDSILGGIEEQSDFTIQNIAEISKEDYQKNFESFDSSKNDENWSEISGKLEKTYQFKDFKEALDFINKVAEISEKMKHHPEILNDYNKVILKLKTHDKNQITELDYKFAKKVDDLFNI
jgi:4a-hydroxytetrahydrobiopterin dehydratase